MITIDKDKWCTDTKYRDKVIRMIYKTLIYSREYRQYKQYMNAKSMKAFPISWQTVISIITSKLLSTEHAAVYPMAVASHIISEMMNNNIPIIYLISEVSVHAFEQIPYIHPARGEIKSVIINTIIHQPGTWDKETVHNFMEKYSNYMSIGNVVSSDYWKIWEMCRQNMKQT